MWKALTIGTILLLVAGLFGVALIANRLHETAYTGSCTKTEIDSTSAAINDMHGLNRAAVELDFDAWRDDKNPYRLSSRLKEWLSVAWIRAFGHRLAAAHVCNHAYVRLDNDRPFANLPVAVDRIRPSAVDDHEAWRLAVCADLARPRPPNIDEVAALRQVCLIRQAAWAKQQ